MKRSVMVDLVIAAGGIYSAQSDVAAQRILCSVKL
ncbi:hypothetical protein ABIE13_004360 [Ottowia thiooxydans]|uniref:Uncharacterized protein n=1 Tax=Ottowia thiooxydans TaxID=219182 RepID=A0ABV2QFB9_9BURK